ncbi:DNA-processing protein DprA [Vibrio sp.]|nr:DNA-processing protein DprA [Vibrio sp.]
MNEETLSAWLTLSLTPRIGPKTFSQLYERFSVVDLYHASSEELTKLGFSTKQVHFFKQESHVFVEESLNWLSSHSNHYILTLDDPLYPSLLKQASAPPPILFVKGVIESLASPQIAIVGSRHATDEALRTAQSFARELSSQGLVITSGLALGIDGYAHDGALNGGGNTIAVLGSGLEQMYPARHRRLANRIVEQGALISEYLPSMKPRPENFPRRNRVISGLSLGVLVVEAAEKSGSLITARYAAEQGRDVFAIPGSIHSPLSRGCNKLIKEGACLIQSTQDIVDELEVLINWTLQQKKSTTGMINSSVNGTPLLNTSKAAQPAMQSDLFTRQEKVQSLPFPEVVRHIGKEPISVDLLAGKTQRPVQEIMTQLLELELIGAVSAVAGGYVRS